MNKMRLGKSELMVSRVGFGAIPIQRLNDEDAMAVVKRCVELGMTYLDTANAYSTSEMRMGRALEDRKEKLIIATKSASRDPEGISAHLAQSLKMLKVDSIDLYQFHNVSAFDDLEKVLSPTGPFPVVEKAKREGKVKHIGITSHQIDVAKEAVKTGRFETVMYPFNFIAHEPGEELAALAAQHDVGFIAMKPFAGGMIEDANLAIKYLLQFPNVLPIPGIEKLSEIEEIIKIAEGSWKLTVEENAEIDRIRAETGNRFCRRCDYCQPCSADIQISIVMAYSNMVKRMPLQQLASGLAASIMEKAKECTHCGLCETRCPYQLPIQEMMAENLAMYEEKKKEYEAGGAR